MPETDPILLKRAKAMRSEMPQSEREVWTALRGKRFQGVKFSRQVVIGRYIADFVARSRKLIIEIDSDTHVDPEKDARRTLELEEAGYRVIRFSNSDVMTNLEGVLTTISAALLDSPSPNPLPNRERALGI